MFEDLFIASVMLLTGIAFFGRFEAYTNPFRKLLKFGMYLGLTALLSNYFGHWSLVGIGAWYGIGIAFHFWWCSRNQINPFTAEPRERYYTLRGWGKAY